MSLDIEDLRELIKGKSGKIELAIEMCGNQDAPFEIGFAQRNDNGTFVIPENDVLEKDKEINLLFKC